MGWQLRKVIKAKTGTYKDGQGNEKSSYTELGVILQDDKGNMVLRMKVIPIGWDGAAFVNDPEQRQQGNAPQNQQRQPQQQRGAQGGYQRQGGYGGQQTQQAGNGFEDMDDDIPF